MFDGSVIYFFLVLQNFIVRVFIIVSAAIKLWRIHLGRRDFLRCRIDLTEFGVSRARWGSGRDTVHIEKLLNKIP